MIYCGIDPGPTRHKHGIVVVDMSNRTIKRWDDTENWPSADVYIVETMSPIGAVLAQVTIDTIFHTGWLCCELAEYPVQTITRREVKRRLLGKVSGSDAEIRMALEEVFGPKGTKAESGHLYGLGNHHRAALACVLAVLGEEAFAGWKP